MSCAMRELVVASSDRYFNFRDDPLLRKLPGWFPWLRVTENLAEADVIFHGLFGNDYLDYPDAVAIEYIGENITPDFNRADYALSFSRLTYGDRHYRCPLYRLVPEYETLFDADRRTAGCPDAAAERDRKTAFCTVVVSNANRDGALTTLFDLLNAYRPIASGGRWRNTFGGRRVEDKQAFLRSGRFSLVFENSATPGYVTEKLVHAFAAHTVPIYWGAPDVSQDFNPKAFIDCSRFASFEAVAEEVRRLDADPAAYAAMLSEPCFADGREPEPISDEALRAWFAAIFARSPEAMRRRNRLTRGAMVWNTARLSVPCVAGRVPALRHAMRLILSKRYRSACRKLGTDV